MSLKRGALIAFEGCDRVGKTTQINLLQNMLITAGHKVKTYKFPNRNTIVGKLIDEYLRGEKNMEDHAIHLLFSANRWECVDEILGSIDNGFTVLMDRYAFSGIAYSAAKPTMAINWCKSSDIGLPKPDLVFYLNSVNSSARSGFGEEIYEKATFQAKVKNNYEFLKEDYWKVIDADRKIDEIAYEISDHVKNLINTGLSNKLSKLWI